MMPETTARRKWRPTRRWAFAGIIAIFLIANFTRAITTGSDLDAYLEAGRRVVAGSPLYGASWIAQGFVGPPAQALLFAPLAALGRQPARVVWFVLNVVLLWYALAVWVGIVAARRSPGGRASSIPWRLPAHPWMVLSLLGIAYPLQTQFENGNLNVVLLALIGWAAAAMNRGQSVLGGLGFGVAAAIKVYPVLLLAWLALRRQWLAVASGIAVLAALTFAPALVRGIEAPLRDLRDWTELAAAGWPSRRANQSLVAMWGRYLLAERPDGYPVVTREHGMVLVLAGLTAIVAAFPLLASRWRHPPSTWRLTDELICVSALGVLMSPIAWEHYWVLFFPLFATLGARVWNGGHREEHSASWWRRSGLAAGFSTRAFWAAAAFWLGLTAITLLSRPIVGWDGARIVRAWSLMTWGGLVMCATAASLLAMRDDDRPRDRTVRE